MYLGIRGEWPAYAGTYASAKYSPLDQITAAKIAALTVAWRWVSPDQAVRTAHAEAPASDFYEFCGV
jgi:glucose dehydrogenase